MSSAKYATRSSRATLSRHVPVDDATLNEYYKRHENDFKTPESVKLQYAELSLRSHRLADSEYRMSDLKSYFDTNKDRFNVPEKRHAHHILIDRGNDDAAALKKAQGIYDQIKSGQSFEALAKEFSTDTGSWPRAAAIWAGRSAATMSLRLRMHCSP